jgi:thioredoxin 1
MAAKWGGIMRVAFFALLLGLLAFAAACTPQEPIMPVDKANSGTAGSDAGSGLIVVGGNEDTEKEGEGMLIQDDRLLMQEPQASGFSGRVLAGSTTPYIEFNSKDYEQALSQGKVVILNFYANWCPSCKAEEPRAFKAFDSLNNADVVGFRVNYKDSDTDESEQDLAKEFGITYQHTKVVIDKDGNRVVKSLENWDAQRYLLEASNYA